MASVPAPTKPNLETSSQASAPHQALIRVLLPYGLAVLAQLPMLLLYFKSLWERPHYQSFPFAIIASIAIVVIRWPYNSDQPFHRSLTSDLLLIIGLISAFVGVLFMEPWFAAFSVLMITTSLLARTFDPETKNSLWTCALPLFACLALPMNYDRIVITRLQAYSAGFTSQLLDLIGLGHHMDGTVINVPGMQQYGIEEACSGVVSFFTLLAVTAVFIVWARRIARPGPVATIVLLITGALLCLFDSTLGSLISFTNGYLFLAGIMLILIAALGFRAGILVMSAVFWALFMNTVRIFVIPISDSKLGFDLSHGFQHDLLGYAVLIIGALLILSTDQFLLFMFGPVESSEDSGQFSGAITRFWNGFLAGETDDETGRSRKRLTRRPMTNIDRKILWISAIIMVCFGLYQLIDVQRSYAKPNMKVQFFNSNTVVDYVENDMPTEIGGNWKVIDYLSEDRSRGSDLGERSDIWQFQAPRCVAVTSIDQTFPGWHELTTCYKNQGWELQGRKRVDPPKDENGESWPYIEARFIKRTGETGYLLFSHFDAFGRSVDAPDRWGSLNSLMIRARNRLSERIRANLFQGEIYQTQVFLRSYSKLDDDVKAEVNDRYLAIREVMRAKFVEKRQVVTPEP